MDDLREKLDRAKAILPLPALIRTIIGGQCPDNGGNHLPNIFTGEGKSFSVFKQGSGYGWRDHKSGESGDEVDAVARKFNLSKAEAINAYLEFALVEKPQSPKPTGNSKFQAAMQGVPVADKPKVTMLPWEMCVSDLSDEYLAVLANSRGLPMGVFSILRSKKQIGLHDDQIAFPIVDPDGDVRRCHFRWKDGKGWSYAGPKGDLEPLVIGCDLKSARKVFVCESQWDGIAALANQDPDTTSIVATRGAGNGKLIERVEIPPDVPVGIVMQNDEPKADGSIPSEAWYRSVIACLGDRKNVFRIDPPREWKDLNDWIRLGKAEDKVIVAALNSPPVAKPAFTMSVRSVKEIVSMKFPENDLLLGDRVLSRGGKMVIAGQGGIGKSRLLAQLGTHIMIGRSFGELACPGLPEGEKILMFQTENSSRRLATELNRMAMHIDKHMGREAMKRFAVDMLFHTLEKEEDSICHLNDKKNQEAVEEIIRYYNPAVVIWDPLYTFTTGDLNSDRDMAEVLGLISRTSKAGNPERAIIIAHHAQTGEAGRAKAVGHDRASFGRNSKVLHSWCRSQLNVIPADEDSNNRLLMSCAKTNDGKEFKMFGLTLNDHTMSYSFFDVDNPGDYILSKKYQQGGSPKMPDGEVLDQVDMYPTIDRMAEYLSATYGATIGQAKQKIKDLAANGRLISVRGKIRLA